MLTHIIKRHFKRSRLIIKNLVMLKDAATGYVSIQTVCSVLRADPYRAWT